jgi:hypothetical protein
LIAVSGNAGSRLFIGRVLEVGTDGAAAEGVVTEAAPPEDPELEEGMEEVGVTGTACAGMLVGTEGAAGTEAGGPPPAWPDFPCAAAKSAISTPSMETSMSLYFMFSSLKCKDYSINPVTQ